jgi:hypothetical protein
MHLRTASYPWSVHQFRVTQHDLAHRAGCGLEEIVTLRW